MKITDITLQAHNKHRVNISVDGAYRVSLDVFQVGELGIKVGREYTEAELAALEDESQFGILYTRAVEYCMMRPRSVSELRDYLWRKTRPTKRRTKTGKVIERPALNPDIAPRVLQRLQEKRYLDDEKFARFWLEHRFVQKGASVRRLRLELVQKGIERQLIDRLIAENIRSDAEELQKIIAKKRHRYVGNHQKFVAYLMRQGFSYEAIQEALQA